MALATIISYCVRADLERILTTVGVTLRVDDDPLTDGVSSITDCINEASETVNFYLYDLYDPVNLASSNLVNRWCTVLACYALCGRRNNPIPESLVDRAEKVEKSLLMVADSQRRIPGVPLRFTQAPSWSNTRCDPRYQFRVIRVERNTSDKSPSRLEQVPDFRDAFTVEL